ncbi:MAG: SLC13 family permease, partial [Pseudomonadota bacterium]
FFAFTEFGLILASVGALYTLFVAPRLLPYKESLGDDAPLSGKHYLAEVTVHPGHPLDGAAAVAGMFKGLSGATVRLVIQNGKTILPPFDGVSLSPGDKIIVAATRKRLFELLKELPGLFGTVGPDPGGARREERLLSEAVVAPGSRLAGRPIREISNELGEGHFIIGIERRSRMRRGEIADIRLEVGDVLLVLADRTWVQALRANRDILLLEWASEEVPDFDRARLSQVIFLGTVGAAILGVNIAAASLVGALLMVATGCLNVRQAARVIDRRIVLLITAALAMGAALEATGGAHLLASGLVSALSPFGPGVVLSAFFLLVAILTNVLSNNATAAIFAPIAITTAQQLGGPGADVTPFVFGMIFAANCSFATPFAYQTNLLVMGPGQYKFMDFVKAGVPLIVLLWLTFSLLAPLYYDLG